MNVGVQQGQAGEQPETLLADRQVIQSLVQRARTLAQILDAGSEQLVLGAQPERFHLPSRLTGGYDEADQAGDRQESDDGSRAQNGPPTDAQHANPLDTGWDKLEGPGFRLQEAPEPGRSSTTLLALKELELQV